MKTAEKKKAKKPAGMYPWERPIEFTEKFKWSDLDATFDAESYTEWMEAALPIMKTLTPMEHHKAKKDGVKIGNRYFYLRPFPMYFEQFRMFGGSRGMCRASLEVYKGTTSREARFSAVVNIPILADQSMSPWMSLTPNEVFTLRGQIRRAKGNVGMAGLGLGWAARKVLERKVVKHLTVYEMDADVIDYFGAGLKEDFGDRITIVHGDAYEVDWMKHDVALWDIWMGVGDAGYDDEYKAIKAKMEDAGKVCVGWTEGSVDRSESGGWY